MVDSGVMFTDPGNQPPNRGGGRGRRRPNPGGPRRPPPGRPQPPRRGAANPPQIDIQGAASPIEETPQDYINAAAVYSTGAGNPEMYHYDRRPMQTQQQLAGAEQAQAGGPGQP